MFHHSQGFDFHLHHALQWGQSSVGSKQRKRKKKKTLAKVAKERKHKSCKSRRGDQCGQESALWLSLALPISADAIAHTFFASLVMDLQTTVEDSSREFVL